MSEGMISEAGRAIDDLLVARGDDCSANDMAHAALSAILRKLQYLHVRLELSPDYNRGFKDGQRSVLDLLECALVPPDLCLDIVYVPSGFAAPPVNRGHGVVEEMPQRRTPEEMGYKKGWMGE